jgi:hypothetical protein
MNPSPNRLFVVVLLVLSTFPAAYSQTRRVTPTFQHQHQGSGSLIEEFLFAIKDFKVEHQSEHNVLNIAVTMRYVRNVKNTDYPDYRAVAKDIEVFLTNYPNEQDYWEIVNKALTSMLLKKYPPLAMITCEITVDPVANSPYTRSSRVVRERDTSKHK